MVELLGQGRDPTFRPDDEAPFPIAVLTDVSVLR
jgi:hypothetical protein